MYDRFGILNADSTDGGGSLLSIEYVFSFIKRFLHSSLVSMTMICMHVQYAPNV